MTQNISQYSENKSKKIKHKIQLKPGWVLLYYKNNIDNNYNYNNNHKHKIICGKYLPIIGSTIETENNENNENNNEFSYNQMYLEKKRREKIFDEYTKNINEYRNIRKELYDEDFSYLDKYMEETYEIYTENDVYSSDIDSCDDNDYYYTCNNEKKFDV